MLFATTEELKESLGTLHRNLSFETLLSFVEQAEAKHLVPVFGTELLEAVSAEKSGLGPVYLAMQKRLRACLVHYVVLDAAPFLAVSLGELGMVEHSAGSATPARQWVYNNFEDAAANSGDQLLDVALVYAEFKAEFLPEWSGSEACRSSREQLIRNAHELSKYLSIGNSRRAYLALLPFMQRVEELELRPLLGDERLDALHLALQAGNLSAEEKKLLDLVRPALAHRTMATALPELAVSITGSGIRVLADNDGIRERKAASATTLSALAAKADGVATQYLERLNRYIDAQQPEAEPWAAELPDNSNSPSFRV
jgi:hypothetical protein